MNDAISPVTDVHQTLTYDSSKIGPMMLKLGLVSLGCGAFIYYISDRPSALDWIMVVFAFALGALATLYGLMRWLHPQPMVTMSPAGLSIHIDFVKTIRIPWAQVRDIDSVDITGTLRGVPVSFSGVTVVLVSPAFYDRYIHVRSAFLRGPGWDFKFIPRGDLMEIALNHEALPATAAEIAPLSSCAGKPSATQSPRACRGPAREHAFARRQHFAPCRNDAPVRVARVLLESGFPPNTT
jgi:hypothetical protein